MEKWREEKMVFVGNNHGMRGRGTDNGIDQLPLMEVGSGRKYYGRCTSAAAGS